VVFRVGRKIQTPQAAAPTRHWRTSERVRVKFRTLQTATPVESRLSTGALFHSLLQLNLNDADHTATPAD